jgi:hypothetical protein
MTDDGTHPHEVRDGPGADEGGDAACWADRVCHGCGVLVEAEDAHRCLAGSGRPSGFSR